MISHRLVCNLTYNAGFDNWPLDIQLRIGTGGHSVNCTIPFLDERASTLMN